MPVPGTRQAYLPVNMANRVGVQVAAGAEMKAEIGPGEVPLLQV